MNPSNNPAEHTASHTANPNGYPTRTAQSPTMYAPDTRAHSLPALLIPEDYRARAVALHARELILRSPQMSAIALGGLSAGLSAGVETAGERPPVEGGTAAGSSNTASAADGGLLQEPQPLSEILENAVDEAICTIDGGYLGNASKEGTGVVKPRKFRAKTVQAAPVSWSYPSVEYVPVNRQTALRYLATELYGLGALDLLLEEGQRAGTITDIYVNSPCDIWMGINGTTRPVALSLGNERRVRELAERLILLEDTAELAPQHEQVIALKTRAANSEGVGEIGLGELIVQALRMGPDRLVVGECRGAEVVHLLTAMNTGHRGAGTTLHANSAQAVPLRLCALGALAGLDSRTVALHTATAFERIIHLEHRDGRRRIEGVYSLHPAAEGSEEYLQVRRISVGSEVGY